MGTLAYIVIALRQLVKRLWRRTWLWRARHTPAWWSSRQIERAQRQPEDVDDPIRIR